jgi:hypothetical protein
MHEDEQYLLFGIEIHELLYCVIMKIAGPHCLALLSTFTLAKGLNNPKATCEN